jgi:hypothetical protein
VKRYRFQALVTLGDSPEGSPAGESGGQLRRVVLHGHSHETGQGKFFSALATRSGDVPPWPDQDPVIINVVLVCDDPREYFDIGDSFSFWLGSDRARGVVTRRLLV